MKNSTLPLALDFRFAARVLSRSPGTTGAIVLVLAFCIGVNSLMFAVLDAAFLRPLPYPSPEHLGKITSRVEGQDPSSARTALDGTTWETLRDQLEHLEVGAFSPWVRGVNLMGGNSAEFAQQRRVSSSYFEVLGVQPRFGRSFTDLEDRPGGPKAVILSYALATELFGRAPEALAGKVLLKGEPHTVVGVMPEDYAENKEVDVWTPLAARAGAEGGGANFEVVARLEAGVSRSRANAELANLSQAALAHREDGASPRSSLGFVPLQSALSRELRRPLLLLSAAVLSVLLIGCFNLASLMLARFGQRSRELALRSALGARGWGLVRLLMVECLLLSAAGGILGTLLGWVGIHLARQRAAHILELPQALDSGLRFAAFSLLLSLGTILLFGLLPALHASRLAPYGSLGGAGSSSPPKGHRVRGRYLLLGGQVAIAFVLLTTSALLLETLTHLSRHAPDLDFSHTLVAKVSLEEERYATQEAVHHLFGQTLHRLDTLPGVQAAAVGLGVPYERWLNLDFKHPGRTDGNSGVQLTDLTYVSEDYFEALGIPLRKGRLFSQHDDGESAPVVLVSESFVRTYLGNEEPIGLEIDLSGGKRLIVGVVEDVPKVPGWGEERPLSAMPTAYVPLAQTPSGFFRLVHTWFSPSWVVRSSRRPKEIAHQFEEVVQAVDPQLPVSGLQSLEQVRATALAQQRLQRDLLVTFSILALLVTIIGLHGLAVRTVNDRELELAIRRALGASPSETVRSALMPVTAAVSAGLLVGGLGVLLAGPTLRHLVWGVDPRAPQILTAVALGFLPIALLAVLGAVVRSMRQDPARVLRRI